MDAWRRCSACGGECEHASARVGDGVGRGSALNLIAWHEVLAGEYASAVVHGRLAVDVCREAGARRNEGSAWDSLGRAQHLLGRHAEAAASLTEACAILREIGVDSSLAIALDHLADVRFAEGDPVAAREALAEAVELYTAQGMGEADDARRRLAALPQPARPLWSA